MALRLRVRWLALLTLLAATLMALAFVFRFGSILLPTGKGVPRLQPTSRAALPASPGTTVGKSHPRLRALSFDPEVRPRNVVLMIGDGMGIGSISTASYLLHGPSGALVAEGAPVTGLVRTWASDRLVTGSPGSASAIATGRKHPKRSISQQPDGSAPITLFEAGREHGLMTGLVTTAGLVDATPAAFVTHVDDRDRYKEILEQMLASDTDLMIGGDWLLYPKAQGKRAYLDRIRGLEPGHAEHHAVVRTAGKLAQAKTPLVALLPARPGSRSAHGPPLADSVELALQLLGESAKGFLLLIENEESDEQAHGGELAGVVEAIEELDAALRVVLDFAAGEGDTLVLLTADHDTGSPGIVRGRYDDGRVEVRWLSNDHTAQWVPLFAWGPGAIQFSGVLENSEIGRRLASLLDLEGLPAAAGGGSRARIASTVASSHPE
jgi:alkaline phosphatase